MLGIIRKGRFFMSKKVKLYNGHLFYITFIIVLFTTTNMTKLNHDKDLNNQH